ncbi:MAG: PorT family protein [Bacteroidales bacterium]|nr:PorT family protein [Bacteroidales bacterium]
MQINLFSQGTDISSKENPGLFIGLSLEPSQSHIINNGTQSVSELLSNKQNSFFGSMEIGYFFSRFFGLSSGIGFISYNTELTLDTYQSNFNAVDSENESYERRVSGSEITEVQNVIFFSVPFCINLRLPFNETMGFFLQPAINMTIPLSNNYTSNGTFSYAGYYPAYNVLLEDLPDYGFPSNKISNSEGEIELKPMSFNVIAAAGLYFIIQHKIQIGVGASYNKSLSNISGYSSPDEFQLSSDPDQINSLMGGSSEATTKLMGLKIIFRYYFK